MGSLKDRRTPDDEIEQRRKYEIEDQDKGQFKTRATMAFVIGNAIGLLKNILFPDEESQIGPGQAMPADSTTAKPLPDDSAGGIRASALPASAPQNSEGTENSTGSTPPGVGAGRSVSRSLSTTGDEPRSSNEIPRPNNDNETLYGTRPGSNVTAFAGAQPGGGGDSVGLAFPSVAGTGGAQASIGADTLLDPGPGPAVDEDEDQDDSDPQNSPNRAPVVSGPVLLNGLLANQTVVIALADLLSRASDRDGDAMTVRDLKASSGDLRNNGNGTWSFTPDRDDTTAVTFAYNISDGETGTRQFAFLDLLRPAASEIAAVQTAETVADGSSNETTAAPVGSGTVQDGDHIAGSGGDDRIFAGAGDDIVFAGAGNDVVFGGPGNDRLFGEGGDDQLFGEAGDDTLVGGPGNDTLVGGPGEDDISGGSGSDLARATIGDGDDRYDGGADTDTYDLSATVADAVVDLPGLTASSLEIGHDHISGFENIVGGHGDDVIIADDATNVMTGGAGDDTFVFRSWRAAGKGEGSRDKILDFEVGDKIDLKDIDREVANTFADALEDQGFRRFVLIREGDAFTAPGQIRFAYEQFEDHEVTIVAGNIDDDEDAEFEIELYGHKDLRDDDFSRHDS